MSSGIAGDSTLAGATDGQVQMKLMGKGNQASATENQITNAALIQISCVPKL